MDLPKYYIPRGLERAINGNNDVASAQGISVQNKFSHVLQILKTTCCLEIARCHYLQFLKLGLYLEEHQQRIDTRKQFEIKESAIAKLPGSEEQFKIDVENLDESNPFLNVSDWLVAHELNKPKTKFFLVIIKVCTNYIIVMGCKKFCRLYKQEARYNMTLKFNTYWYQCCHYALNAVPSIMISHCMFPEKRPAVSTVENYPQYWFNDLLNIEQKQAILNIVNKSSFPAPYILYGPPGTGKTSTLVEAILQTWKRTDGYILICAPSNAACDVVTKRLLSHVPSSNLYRMYSRTEQYSRIDECIKKCCNFKDGKVDEINKVDLSCKKIVITTLCSSLRLETLKLPFSHLFVDEGGQATLTDILLPLCATKFLQSLQIVISGDHQQLGPSIKSKLAEPLLGQSILEKLMKCSPYKKDAKSGYDSRYITKLIRNYRSSEEIIHVPNALFYDNELISVNKTNLSVFPVSFYAVNGEESKSTNSMSSYNNEEIKTILGVINSAIGSIIGDKVITKEDIGIVTPFKLQVLKMREKLDDAGLNEVSVGTVEVYQGQEKEMIIISTVRSKTFKHDGVEHIGFLSNPKRFNVALTRAKSMLVVVGNPNALQTNDYWRYFLKFCKKHNTCRGAPFKLKDDMYFSLQEFNIESKSKKSTDLFNVRLQILRLDDGILNKSNSNRDESTNSNNRAETTSAAATTSSTISPMRPLNAMGNSSVATKAPISTVNKVPNYVPENSISNPPMKSRSLIRNNSSVSTSPTVRAPISNVTNSVRNAATTREILKAPISSINAGTNLGIPTWLNNTNSTTRNSHLSSATITVAGSPSWNSENSINNPPIKSRSSIRNNISVSTSPAVRTPISNVTISVRNAATAREILKAPISSINAGTNLGIPTLLNNTNSTTRNSHLSSATITVAESPRRDYTNYRKPVKLKKKKGCLNCCIL